MVGRFVYRGWVRVTRWCDGGGRSRGGVRGWCAAKGEGQRWKTCRSAEDLDVSGEDKETDHGKGTGNSEDEVEGGDEGLVPPAMGEYLLCVDEGGGEMDLGREEVCRVEMVYEVIATLGGKPVDTHS